MYDAQEATVHWSHKKYAYSTNPEYLRLLYTAWVCVYTSDWQNKFTIAFVEK